MYDKICEHDNVTKIANYLKRHDRNSITNQNVYDRSSKYLKRHYILQQNENFIHFYNTNI